MQANTSPKRPSPLSAHSPRPSPFKRPETPEGIVSPSSTIRAASPISTPTRAGGAQPNNLRDRSSPISAIFAPQTNGAASMASRRGGVVNGDPLSKLTPTQLHEMRESFQVLDGNNDGQVNSSDVAEVLTQLGLAASGPSLAPYFPSGASQNMSLPNYLNTLAGLLAPMSAPSELIAAYGAFDIDDSGQIDMDELREALLQMAPDNGERKLTARDIDAVVEGFTSRRALARGMAGNDIGKRGDVFRYGDWLGQIQGGKPQGDMMGVESAPA